MPTILIIEDEPDQNKLIRLRLEARGYRVIAVARAKEGIESARRERPDLILLDMILPDMHGLDAAIQLKKMDETRTIPIVAISAVGSPDFIKACLQEGIVAYVRKPYEPRELVRVIEKHLRDAVSAEKKKAASPAASPTGKPRASFEEELERIEREFKRSKSRKTDDRRGPARENGGLSQTPSAEVKSNAEPPPRPSRPGPKSILIIDDDQAFVRTVADLLIARSYAVDTAADGISGLKQAFEKKPDLILLNLVLPSEGGEALLSHLRKSGEFASTPVFIMSSLLSARDLEDRARELGAQGFIAKPIEPEDLCFIVESVVGA